MKKLLLIFCLIASPALAEDPTPSPDVKAPQPVYPPRWSWQDMDKADVINLNSCVLMMPKRDADVFLERIQANVKPVMK